MLHSVSMLRSPRTFPSGGTTLFVTRCRRWSGSGSSVIACDYEDQNDADTLRHDPLLKLVCGRLPDEADLASQPTLSRLENAVDVKACYRLAVALLHVYLHERGRDGLPDRIVLDFDGTDDPAHGGQEGVAYHGYYQQHMLHPLLVFDGDTGQLIIAVLRPGKTRQYLADGREAARSAHRPHGWARPGGRSARSHVTGAERSGRGSRRSPA